MNLPPYHPFRSEAAQQAYLNYYDNQAQSWPVAAETRMIDTRYGQTFVRINGPVDGPALVLLHGAGITSLMWSGHIATLSQNYRTYAIDNIYDFGRSISTRTITKAQHFVEWLDGLFTNLGITKCHFVGMSFGGWIASQYALRHPERLKSLVLIAPAATILPIQPSFWLRVILMLIPHPAMAKQLMYWLFADSVQRGGVALQAVDNSIVHLRLGFRSFKLRNPLKPTVLTDQELSQLPMPTLFLVGENEKVYQASKAIRRIHTVAPQIETAVISNAGHDLTLLEPDRINHKILSFLDAHDNKPAQNRVVGEFSD